MRNIPYISQRNASLTPNPNLYHLPPLSEFEDPILLPVTDIRPSLQLGDQSPYKLSVHGFTGRYAPSQLHGSPYTPDSWNNKELIKAIYIPEVEELVKRISGCTNAIVESAVLRNNLHSEVDVHADVRSAADFEEDDSGPCPRIIGFNNAGGASPAPKVHLDFSPLGARTHIRKYHRNLALAAKDIIMAENRLLNAGVTSDQLKDYYYRKDGGCGIPRFALFSVWRPLKTVRRDPLAVASCVNFPLADLVSVDLVQPSEPNIPPELSKMSNDPTSNPSKFAAAEESSHFSGSYLAYCPSEETRRGHDWHFISNQEPEDVLLIQLFDSEMEARVGEGNKAHEKPNGNAVLAGTVHSAFELANQSNTAEARESIEVRVLATW
ncbi:hypothetical protein AARAC_000593 [Aspergillus arachidicola]|uniref:GA4 desaturase n=1 Tax=Aspergillus arachidicola TaxID=656916 RepID=A0A2G7G714_9EURO|nr:hypothetical protein AARAC_000593 [Aspergillus arachidicola]